MNHISLPLKHSLSSNSPTTFWVSAAIMFLPTFLKIIFQWFSLLSSFSLKYFLSRMGGDWKRKRDNLFRPIRLYQSKLYISFSLHWKWKLKSCWWTAKTYMFCLSPVPDFCFLLLSPFLGSYCFLNILGTYHDSLWDFLLLCLKYSVQRSPHDWVSHIL